MKRKIQFAVILTEEGKTVLMVDNAGVYHSTEDWQSRAKATNGKLLFASQTDSIDIHMTHWFIS